MAWLFDTCGGHLALDFANTVSDRGSDRPIDRLAAYADVVSFARQTNLISGARAATLLRGARRDPDAAGRALDRARVLRDATYEIFAAVAREERPTPRDLQRLNRELGRLCIGADLALGWRDDGESLDGFLGGIVHASVQLLTTEQERARVRLCEAPGCLWLFYDASRNRSRRWCDMRVCGNRMKARRHYARGRGNAD
ncbi:MAG TPA: CGNR zinc finger domain-containing protein [Pseudomonadales bacterium]